jgi:S-formylglutathione hydrolase FrmB
MNVDLFAAGFLAGVGVVTASVITYLVTRLLEYKGQGKSKKALARKQAWQKKQIKYFSAAAGAAIIAALLLGLLLGVLDRTDKLPSDIWLMFLPTTISGILLAVYVRRQHKRHSIISICALVFSLTFGLLLVNNYYRFYPTLYSVIGLQNRIKVIADRKTTTFQYAKGSASAHNTEDGLYGNVVWLQKGKVMGVNIPGTTSKFKARNAWIYVPPVAERTQIKLPVIIMMAGVPGSPGDWLNGGGLQATLDAFAQAHHGITPLVAVVDQNGSSVNDTECVDSPRGNVETYLSTDVPGYLKQHFAVSEDSAQWAIGGLSLGGMCGLMLTLRHTDTFHYFLDFGGESGPEIGSQETTIRTLFNGSTTAYEAHLPMKLLQKQKYTGIGGFFAIGKNDKPELVEDMQNMYAQTKKSDMNTVMELVGGEHTFNVWQQSFKDALPWVSNQLGATSLTVNH